MRTVCYRCRHCSNTEERQGKWGQQPPDPLCSGCDRRMVRDYRAESASATFKGGGWARGSK